MCVYFLRLCEIDILQVVVSIFVQVQYVNTYAQEDICGTVACVLLP